MNRKLQEERAKALELLKGAEHKQKFNLSDLKVDKTQYFDSQLLNSPFQPSEFSARSTILHNNAPNKTFDCDFDEIMRNSTSSAVRSKYRESMGRLSVFPRTTDMSMRSSVSTSSLPKASGGDFWDNAKIASNSFVGSYCSNMSESFRPAEEMDEMLKADEMEQEKEFATIPRVQKSNSNESNWEVPNRSGRQPEMSFGQYIASNIATNNIRDIYGNTSPAKKGRVALVELDNLSTPSETSRLNLSNLQKMIQNCDTPSCEELLRNFGKGAHKKAPQPDLSGMISSISINNVMALAKKETDRMKAEKEKTRSRLDVVPVKDDPDLGRSRNAIPSRGLKRRSSSVNSESTPKSTLDKCMRSKSPALQKELQAVAATLLKPKLPSGVFKVPQSGNFSSFGSSKASHSPSSRDASSNREYVTANSMHSPVEKFSLPNYQIMRPENIFTSPTSSVRSHRSPNSSHDGQLKRTVSQLSNGSEFHDDVLPIRIKKSNRKLSWPSVKLYHSVTRTITIQNGSSKKLPLHVKVTGAGFSVAPREDFRMIPQEARSFDVKFSPTAIGPATGQLIFELVTNSKCIKSIPLFAYGGHASMRLEGTQKGPVGPQFISMGQIQMLNSTMKQQVRVQNNGTLPGFAAFVFDSKPNWGDFGLSKSLTTTPSEVRLMPGESAIVNIHFKATREEIRKAVNLSKEITTIGEICVISGDEPTRLRLLNNKDIVPQQILKYLPTTLTADAVFKRQLQPFTENLDRNKLSDIMEQIKIHEIALTINRNLDDTQVIAAELSMADDTEMSFETFCDTNYNRTVVEAEVEEVDGEKTECWECSYFRVIPATVIFSRQNDVPNHHKSINVQSTCSEQMFTEAVSSKHDLISAIKSCGVLEPGGSVEIKVIPKLKAFETRTFEPITVTVLIGNARVEVPVKFVD